MYQTVAVTALLVSRGIGFFKSLGFFKSIGFLTSVAFLCWMIRYVMDANTMTAKKIMKYK